MSDTFVDAIRNGDPRALQAVDRLLENMGRIHGPAGRDLSERELAVVYLMSYGHSYHETGRVLYVEEGTVKTLISRARQKLGARNTTHAVAIALREGMIR